LRLDGERVREGRERLALSIENVSAKARVSPHTWVRAEHGEEIRPSSVRRIAEALGVEPGQLMGETAPSGKAHAPSPPPPEISEEERREMLRNGRDIVERLYSKLEAEAQTYKAHRDAENLQLVVVQAFCEYEGLTRYVENMGLKVGRENDDPEGERFARSLARLNDLGEDLARDLEVLADAEGVRAPVLKLVTDRRVAG